MKSLLFLSLMLASLSAWAAPITVRVVDEAGAPVEGATVQVQRFDKVTPPYTVATTDAQGVANYEMDASNFNPDFYGRVAAWKAGRAISGANLLKLKDGAITLTLDAGTLVSGIIEDDKGPVEGALVQLQSINANGGNLFLGLDSPLTLQLGARSDAAGKFTLGGVPANAKLGLRVSSERYVSQRVEAQSGGEVSVKLLPGATLRGQVLGVDGAPLVGLRVSAQSQSRGGGNGWADAKTDADGNYALSGLSGGSYNVSFTPAPDAGYVVAAREGAIARAGETSQLETARAAPGVVVRGRVIDATTKAGVPNISVGVYGPARPSSSAMVESFETDKDGNFAARLVPGANRFYVMGAPQQWIRPQQQVNLDVSADGDNAIPDFELAPATPIRGRIVDEGGQGVKASLVFRQKWEEWPLQSDENGDFTTYGPKDGEVSVGRPRFTGGGNDATLWEVERGQTFSLPPKAPLRIVVKPAVVGELTGRVDDENGQPIAGVKLDLSLTTGEGDNISSQMQTIFSDANGRFRLPNLRSDQSLSLRGVEKSGYDREGGGEVTRDGNNWRLQTIVLRARNGQLAGRIQLADSAPAANARVFAAGSETRADAQGNFVLKSLPSGNVEVIAYADGQFGWKSAVAGADKAAPLELKLAPQTLQPTDRELAGEMINRAKVLAATTNYYATAQLKLSAPADTKRALEDLIAKPNPQQLAQLIYMRADDADVPIELLLRAVRATNEPIWRLYAATMLFARRADWPDDEGTRALLGTLKDDATAIAAKPDASDKWSGAIGLIGLAPIIERFEGEAAGNAVFTGAVQWIWKQFPEKRQGGTPNRETTLAVVAGLVAANSPHLYARFFDYIQPESNAYARTLQEGAVALAKSSGLEVAAPYLRKLMAAPKPAPDENGNTLAIDYMALQATREAIEKGGAKAPDLSLQLARELRPTEGGFDDEASRALAAAAFYQSPAVAAQLWKETLPQMSAERAAQLAIRIIPMQPQLGRELLSEASQKLEAADEDEQYRGHSAVAAFAFYEAGVDAARARYRLEKEWWGMRAKPNESQQPADLVRAMTAIDGERAFEWASLMPESENRRNARIEALRKAAQYLEADKTLRARVDFERWGRGDTVFVD